MNGVPRSERMRTVAEELELSDDALQTGRMLALRASKSRSISGRRGSDNIAAAALVLGAKQANEWYTVKDIANCWREVDAPENLTDEFSMKSVLRAQKALAKEFGMDNFPPRPEELVDRHGTDLGVPEAVVDAAKRILADVREEAPTVVTGGRSPDSIAASALYLAVYLNDLRLEFTQETIADAVDVTTVTVRKTYTELSEALGGVDELEASKTYSVDDAATSLSDRSFVFSGRLVGSGLSRSEVRDLVEQHGAEAPGSVSKFTDYLVVGDDPGETKLESAAKWETTLLDEHDFFELVADAVGEEITVPDQGSIAVPPALDTADDADDTTEPPVAVTADGGTDESEEPTESTHHVELSEPVMSAVESLVGSERIESASAEAFVGDSVRAAITRRLESDETPDPVEVASASTATVTVPLDHMLAEMVDALVTSHEAFDDASAFAEAVVRERIEAVAEPASVSVTLPVDVSIALAERVATDDEYTDPSEVVRDVVVEALRET